LERGIRDPKKVHNALVIRLPHDRIMDQRIRSRQVAIDKAAKQKKNDAAVTLSIPKSISS